jgi:hypothetical protein
MRAALKIPSNLQQASFQRAHAATIRSHAGDIAGLSRGDRAQECARSQRAEHRLQQVPSARPRLPDTHAPPIPPSLGHRKCQVARLIRPPNTETGCNDHTIHRAVPPA